MVKGQYKNTINKSQGNMGPPEPSYGTTASPGYSNTAETKENNLNQDQTSGPGFGICVCGIKDRVQHKPAFIL